MPPMRLPEASGRVWRLPEGSGGSRTRSAALGGVRRLPEASEASPRSVRSVRSDSGGSHRRPEAEKQRFHALYAEKATRAPPSGSGARIFSTGRVVRGHLPTKITVGRVVRGHLPTSMIVKSCKSDV